MKLIICFLFGFILMWQNNSVNGDLNGLFNAFQGSVNKVRQDVRGFLKIDRKEKQKDVVTTTEVPKVTTTLNTTPAEINNKVSQLKVTEPTPPATNSPTVATTVVKQKSDKKDEQDSRENISGSACLVGYYRTADGRCKPTF